MLIRYFLAMKPLLVIAALAAHVFAGMPAASAVEQVHFSSASGNIGCFMDPWHVRCDIGVRDWSPPPRPANCPDSGPYAQDYGMGIVLNVDGDGSVAFACANDSLLGAGSVLPYGEEIQVDSIRCQMSPSGVACQDFMNGKGFSMSREGYEFF